MKSILLGIALLTCVAPSLAQKPARAASVPAKSPLDRRIDLTTETARLETILRRVCQIIEVPLEIKGSLPLAPVALTVTKTRARTVLTGLALMYRFGLRIETRSGKTVVVAGQNLPVPHQIEGDASDADGTFVIENTPDQTRVTEWARFLVDLKGGLKVLGEPSKRAALLLSALVGETRLSDVGRKFPQNLVSIDMRSPQVGKQYEDAKLALARLLKSAGVRFALLADVPDDVSTTLILERVPLSVALDALCDAMKVMWFVEVDRDEVIVRVGKDINKVFGQTIDLEKLR